jgi:hypothetical protein
VPVGSPADINLTDALLVGPELYFAWNCAAFPNLLGQPSCGWGRVSRRRLCGARRKHRRSEVTRSSSELQETKNGVGHPDGKTLWIAESSGDVGVVFYLVFAICHSGCGGAQDLHIYKEVSTASVEVSMHGN